MSRKNQQFKWLNFIRAYVDYIILGIAALILLSIVVTIGIVLWPTIISLPIIVPIATALASWNIGLSVGTALSVLTILTECIAGLFIVGLGTYLFSKLPLKQFNKQPDEPVVSETTRLIHDEIIPIQSKKESLTELNDFSPGENHLNQVFLKLDAIEEQKEGPPAVRALRELLKGKETLILQALEEHGSAMRVAILEHIEQGDVHRAQKLLQTSYVRKLRALFHPDKMDKEMYDLADKISRSLSEWLVALKPEVEAALRKKGLLVPNHEALHTFDKLEKDLAEFDEVLAKYCRRVEENEKRLTRLESKLDEKMRNISVEAQKIFEEAQASVFGSIKPSS